jgi:subtilisin-like proprotein convertase family protein
LDAGNVYYSTIPLDFYVGGNNNFNNVYAPNALVYVYSLLAPEADFYQITVPGGKVPSGGVRLELSAARLAGGDGEFVNELDPNLRLYDSSGTPLAAGGDLLTYPIVPAVEDRSYYVEVLSSNLPPVGPTKGEYVLAVDVVPLPPPPGIIVSKTSLTTSEPNVADTFTVRLATEPTGDVTMTIESGDTAAGTVSPGELSFSTASGVSGGWDVPQTVTVTGVNDDVDDGDEFYTITLTASGGDYGGLSQTVSAINLDDDTADITVEPTEGLVTTETGGTATFTVVLDTEPTAEVEIKVHSSDTSEGQLAGAVNNELSLTFDSDNWNTGYTVTVQGVDDDDADLDVAYTIITDPATGAEDYVGIDPADVSVVNEDNEAVTVTTYTSTDVPRNIVDQGTIESTLTISDPETDVILDLDVQLNIRHTYDADLDVYLISPTGTEVELFSDVGGSGNNFADTILDDEAALSITEGAAPFSGSFRPEGNLSDLDGEPLNGTWTLRITDDSRRDKGKLNSWQITVTHATTVGGDSIAADSSTASEALEGLVVAASVQFEYPASANNLSARGSSPSLAYSQEEAAQTPTASAVRYDRAVDQIMANLGQSEFEQYGGEQSDSDSDSHDDILVPVDLDDLLDLDSQFARIVQ